MNTTSPLAARCILLTVSMLLLNHSMSAADDKKPSVKQDGGKVADKDGWKPLFNGKDLTGWKVTNFGGEGEVVLEDGNVVIRQGADLSGITSTAKDLPKTNYEVEFEAQRALGNDFFIGLTFPVQDSSASLICGGWGGGVCGISSLDGLDASENDTTTFRAFTNGEWHKVRVKVTPEKIEAWLDENNIVDVEIADRKVDVRFEVELSKPMGFSTYQSTAFIRNARMRTLPTEPAADPGAKKEGAANSTK
ncbi:MAG: DUF1080 domain-containing protein [Planctomycetaceae bacterium]